MRMLLRGFLALMIPLGGLAQKVNIEFDESVDFSNYRTYGWKAGRINSRHPALDNSLVDRRIQKAVNSALAAKGLKETTGKPDLIVTYVLGARDRKEVDVVPAGWRMRRVRREVHRYTQGTLVLDLRDAARRELVWRATCEDTASDPAKFEKRLDESVEKAFKKYPPKKK